jgi:hypothetical protein
MRGAIIGIHLWNPCLSLWTFIATESVTPVLEVVRPRCTRASTVLSEAGSIERHSAISLELQRHVGSPRGCGNLDSICGIEWAIGSMKHSPSGVLGPCHHRYRLHQGYGGPWSVLDDNCDVEVQHHGVGGLALCMEHDARAILHRVVHPRHYPGWSSQQAYNV